MKLPRFPVRPSDRSVAAYVRHLARPIAAVTGIGAVLALSGCGPDDPNGFAPECVPVGILADAADLSTYAGPSHDVSTLVSQTSIAGVNGTCSNAKRGHALLTKVSVVIGIARGPAAGTHDFTIPYFVALLHGSDIVEKHALSLEAQFPPNVERLALKSDPLVLELPISRAMSSDSYRLEIGLQLTPEQLAYNRDHLQR